MTYTHISFSKVLATGAVLASLFLAGCTIPGLEAPEAPAPKTIIKEVIVTVTPEPTAEMTPETSSEPTATAEAIQTPEVSAEPVVESTPTPVAVSADAEFDAKVQAAVEAYIANNKAQFGKQVVESANFYQAEQQADAEAQKAEKVKDVPGISDKDHVLGNKDATFVLYEYSDYQCPFCKRFHPTSKEFIEKNSDVALVFRGMPLDQLHPKSRGIHEVSECVAEISGNDAFWKFSDSVFAKEVTSNKDYKDAAKKAGVSDMAALEKCVDSGKHVATVKASADEGASLGIQGTPTSILKNMKTGEVRLIGGAYPLEALESLLAELK